jgi:insulysin
VQFYRKFPLGFGLTCPHRYIVATLRWSSVGTTALRFRVQSRKDPVFLEERIELFLSSFFEQLKTMSDEDFSIRRRGLIMKKLEKSKNLAEEAGDYWNQIRSGYYNFSQGGLQRHRSSEELLSDFTIDEADAAALESVTKAQMLEMYETYLLQSGPLRRTRAVHMISRKLEAALPLPGKVTEIIDIHGFKAGLDSTPGAAPVAPHTPSIPGSRM